jgi:hypothetical protein
MRLGLEMMKSVATWSVVLSGIVAVLTLAAYPLCAPPGCLLLFLGVGRDDLGAGVR